MTRRPPSVSVVVCTYTDDRWDDLCAAIASLRAQRRVPDEIVVVVDHAPALFARASAAFESDVHVVENARTPGLSGARNTGIAASRGEIVAFLDDDAVAEPDWLDRLLAPYADPRVVAVGGRVVPRWEVARPRWFPPEFDWVVGCTYVGHRETAGEVRNVIGANMSFRRSTLEAAGEFRSGIGRDATAPTGCEETELCIRARQHDCGSVIWYAPDAVVAHRVPAARATPRYFLARCSAEGVSKARISRHVGTRDGLASERAYLMRTLPRAIARDLLAGSLGRVLAAVAGVIVTSAGLVRERVTGRCAVEPFEPALVAQVELDAPIPDLPAVDERTGRVYRRAVVLVRRDAVPIGTVEVSLGDRGCAADDLRREIEARLDVTTEPAGGRRERDRPALRPHVTVVVATRDRPAQLETCLRSVLGNDYPSFDVLVVDSAPSTETARDLVEKLAETNPGLRYVREELPGLARAHNRALPETDAPIVAFTDDDVVVDPRWISMLVAAFAAGDRVGCVTGTIAPLELETAVQEIIERATGFGKGVERRVFDLAHPPEGDVLFPYTAGTFGSGANMAFAREALEAMGGFDPALGAGTRARGGDDLAAFFDVLQCGFQIVYEPGAVVFHRHRPDFDGLRRQAFGYGAGLGAYLAKTICDRPSRAVDIARRLPHGVAHLVHPESPKNARLPAGYPRRLTYTERLGVLAGPVLYAASRRDVRHARRARKVYG